MNKTANYILSLLFYIVVALLAVHFAQERKKQNAEPVKIESGKIDLLNR